MHSYNFLGSALVIMLFKCWNLENLNKFPRKYMKQSKTAVLSSTSCSQFYKNYSQVFLLLLLI